MRLPLGCLKILNVFVTKDKEIMLSDDIKAELGINDQESGKRFGAHMATFGKYKKSPIIYQAGKERWILDTKYRELLKEVLPKLRLDDA